MTLLEKLRGKQKNDHVTPAKKEAHVHVEGESKKEVSAPARNASTQITGVLLHALITEKGTRLEANNVYQFAVAQNADKITIGRAFAARYGVKPIHVRVMHRMGKWVRFGKGSGVRSNWKRALITVPKDKTVNVHEGV